MPPAAARELGDGEQVVDVDQPYFEQLDPALLAERYDAVEGAGVEAAIAHVDRDVRPDPPTGSMSANPRPSGAMDQHPNGGPRLANAPRSGEGRSPQNGQHAGPRPQNPGFDRPPGVPTCTAPQLRRFIKSRAYVPMHELRRRFAIVGDDDDVSRIELEGGRIFVGLPPQEGQLLGDLVRGGEIGFELSMDPETPIVVGVYAMRPVPRS